MHNDWNNQTSSSRFTAIDIVKSLKSQLHDQNLSKSMAAPTHGRQASATNFKDKKTDDKERQCTTRGIKHWGLSGYTSILPRIKFGVTGQESSP